MPPLLAASRVGWLRRSPSSATNCHMNWVRDILFAYRLITFKGTKSNIFVMWVNVNADDQNWSHENAHNKKEYSNSPSIQSKDYPFTGDVSVNAIVFFLVYYIHFCSTS